MLRNLSFLCSALRRMNHFPQRLVALGHPRLFGRLVKSRSDARIGHNSNGIVILYNDRGFIELGSFVSFSLTNVPSGR